MKLLKEQAKGIVLVATLIVVFSAAGVYVTKPKSQKVEDIQSEQLVTEPVVETAPAPTKAETPPAPEPQNKVDTKQLDDIGTSLDDDLEHVVDDSF